MSEIAPKHDDRRMSLAEHLEELRRRVFYMVIGLAAAMAITLTFAQKLILVLKQPYVDVMNQLGMAPNLAVLTVSAGFNNYMKVGLYSGLVLASPWLFYQLWAFIAVGLFPKERRYVILIAPLCALLFISGAAFFMLVVAEQMLYYLLAFSKWLEMVPVITFDSHISFMMQMMLIFGLAFQTPVFILALVAIGAINLGTLHHYRRHAIVAILIVAGIITPPDPFSQIALSVPLYLLFEFGVLLSYLLVERPRRARDAEQRAFATRPPDDRA